MLSAESPTSSRGTGEGGDWGRGQDADCFLIG